MIEVKCGGMPSKTYPFADGYITNANGNFVYFYPMHILEPCAKEAHLTVKSVVDELLAQGKTGIGAVTMFEDKKYRVEKTENGIEVVYAGREYIVLLQSLVTEVYNGKWGKPKIPTTAHNLVTQVMGCPWWDEEFERLLNERQI